MSKEIVVHVTTIEQWKSVLDVWFAQGCEWGGGTKKYYEEWFDSGDRFIGLFKNLVILVTDDSAGYIEYADFMEQKEKTMGKKKDGNVMVELSQFMVAAIIQKYAQFDEDGDLIVDADEYNSVVVEGTPVSDKGENNG